MSRPSSDEPRGRPEEEAPERTPVDEAAVTGSPVENAPASDTTSSQTGLENLLDDVVGCPESIAKYRVEYLLGEGGFGRVYLGRDEELDRSVAVKIAHAGFDTEGEAVDLYLQEARILASLDHPGIVPLYDFGKLEDGRCYLVEKYVGGGDLSDLLRRRRPSFEETAQIVASVADALHVVHTHPQRLVHRDIKPANILIDGHGNPVVTDFGLALMQEDFGRPERLGGTIQYMSPEQARQEGHLVDGRSDVFSLGVVLYEMLTGMLPFRGADKRQTLEFIQTLEPRPPRMVDDTIPRSLERICLRALAKRVTDRYSTAADLAEELRAFLDPLPATETEAPPEQPRFRGLRSYDREDSGFFLELLPGPRSPGRLPDSVLFWKRRIEETEPDETFRAGLIYGPSGGGKSSLVRAGLLPNLDRSVVQPILVEATPDNTERRLGRELRKVYPQYHSEKGLAETLAAVRRSRSTLGGRKLLLVLDQFEQWLHGRTDLASTDLVRALRQCDGQSVQCVVIVRDDFWMAVTRFMKELDTRFQEGVNSAAVDLFDRAHARKVLTMFGRSFGPTGPLGDSADELTKSQKRFVREAVSGLATEGKVVPARLALFAEMVKDKSWSPGILKNLGGAEGVGVAFLDETFRGRMSPPLHRLHENGARRVLRALLPASTRDMKGHMRSRDELLEAAGPRYTSGGRSFDELMAILDGGVRLVTPVDPEAIGEDGDATANPSRKYYQLTHDFLVPPVREWISREERKTARGRARVRLAERAALYRSRPERRQLPSLWEWLRFLALTRWRAWDGSERSLMRASARSHLVSIGGVAALLVMATFLGNEALQRTHASGLVNTLAQSDLNRVLNVIAEDLEPHRSRVEPILRRTMLQTRDDRERLKMRLALLPGDRSQMEPLREKLLGAEPEELEVIRAALSPFANDPQFLETLWDELENGAVEARRFRAACALAAYDHQSDRWERTAGYVARLLIDQSPLETPDWIQILKPGRAAFIPPLRMSFQEQRGKFSGQHAAAALTVYMKNEPAGLIALLRESDASQLRIIAGELPGEPFLARLKQEVSQPWPPLKTGGSAPEPEELDQLAAERANLVLALLFAHPDSDVGWNEFRSRLDPRLKTILIHRLVPCGIDPAVLITRLLENNSEVSVRRSLLLGLGNYQPRFIQNRQREALLAEASAWFERDPDPGIHSASEWLLQRWGSEDVVRSMRERLAGVEREGARRWRVTAHGQTMIRVPNPQGFQVSEEGFQCFLKVQGNKAESHVPQLRIQRGFEIAAKEVTVAQFSRFLRERASRLKKLGVAETSIDEFVDLFKVPALTDAHRDRPMQGVRYIHAIEYCNWLSESEGMTPCYVERTSAGDGVSEQWHGYEFRPHEDGYRLPTFSEWEFAARAGTTSDSYFGVLRLAGSYGWSLENSEESSHPVGQLKPNDYGIFDILGNASEITHCCFHPLCDGMPFLGWNYLQEAFYLSPLWPWRVERHRRDEETGFRIARTLRQGEAGN